jgi:hypothetical protein
MIKERLTVKAPLCSSMYDSLEMHRGEYRVSPAGGAQESNVDEAQVIEADPTILADIR